MHLVNLNSNNMLFSWQFVLKGMDNKSIFVFAKDYNEAHIKVKEVGKQIPGFYIRNWEIEEIIEIE